SGGIKTVTGIGINFFKADIDGIEVCGVSRITVEVDSSGNVTDVVYNIRRNYKSKVKAAIISVEEAFQKIKSGECMVHYVSDNSIIDVKIDDVTFLYWEQSRNSDNLMIQPIYAFTGLGYDRNGESEKVVILVQANRINSDQYAFFG
ncbi:MAG: hypothetical protein KBT31_04090, partial [Firmicutes bacterium]|nr:hypothetical protein [Candidatus Colimorpha enterica]